MCTPNATLAIAVPSTHSLAHKPSLTFRDNDGKDFLLMEKIGFIGD